MAVDLTHMDEEERRRLDKGLIGVSVERVEGAAGEKA